MGSALPGPSLSRWRAFLWHAGCDDLLHVVTLRGNELELYRAVEEDGSDAD
jgi:hypothetical protein